MNPDHWIARLDGPDARTALTRLGGIDPSFAQAALPSLRRLMAGDDGVLAREAARLAIRLDPAEDEDIRAILRFLLQSGCTGSMLPDVVRAFEDLAPRSEETLALLEEALAHTHFRVRVAALRALETMGDVRELVEESLERALHDPSGSVASVAASMLLEIPARHVPEAEALERRFWIPRALALNGIGEDAEDVVFFVRGLTVMEGGFSENELLDGLLVAHGLPSSPLALREIDRDAMGVVLPLLLRPIASDTPVVAEPTDILVEALLAPFDPEVRIFSNATVQDGKVQEVRPVSFGLVDVGLIWMDGDRVGMFWVVDED